MNPLYYVVLIFAIYLAGALFLGWIMANVPDDDFDTAMPIPLMDRDGYLCELLHTTPVTYGDNDEPAN